MAGASTPRRASLKGPRSSPVIGVTTCLDPGRRLRPGADYWYLNRNYTRALLGSGAIPVLLTPDTPVQACLDSCDGLVLSGGGDLPHSFRAADFSGGWADGVPGEAESMERISWERALLDGFARHGRQVLGVCFGMQLMNLHFGGTLLTDLRQRPDAGLDHGHAARPSRHALRVSPDSPFFANWEPPAGVSSAHRQGIAELAPGFVASAWADDGLVEAIERGPLMGVEWHPEADESGAFIYARLVARILDES
jgi:putative glutamine amidotransferase